MIIVAGWMDVDPELRDRELVRLAARIRMVRTEPGCLAYVFSADPLEPARLQMFECWASQADFEAHGKRNREGPKTSERAKVVASDFRIYEVAGSRPMPFG